MCGNLTTWCFFTDISEGMSTLVTRGKEVKLKCNYNVRGRGEHRNLERQYGSQTSGAVNCGDRKLCVFCSRHSSHELWSLRSSPPLPLTKPSYLGPLSVCPRESQTLSADAAGPSVAHDELCLFLSSY